MGSIFFLNRYCHRTLPLRLFFHPFCVFSNDTIYTYPRALDSNDAFAKLGVWSLHISSFSSPKGNTVERNCGDKKDNCKISLWFWLGIYAHAVFFVSFSKVLHCVWRHLISSDLIFSRREHGGLIFISHWFPDYTGLGGSVCDRTRAYVFLVWLGPFPCSMVSLEGGMVALFDIFCNHRMNG